MSIPTDRVIHYSVMRTEGRLRNEGFVKMEASLRSYVPSEADATDALVMRTELRLG